MLPSTNKSHFRLEIRISPIRTKLTVPGKSSPKDGGLLPNAYVLIALLILILLIGCKQTSSETIPGGAYAYTSYDSGGAALVSGWLTIIVSDSTTISGEWHFKSIGSPQRIGPQTGDGKLVGGINNDQVWIELNPQVRNNNLQLNGSLTQGQLAGQWSWISYNGIANQGTFKASRK